MSDFMKNFWRNPNFPPEGDKPERDDDEDSLPTTAEQRNVLLKWAVILLAVILLVLVLPPVCRYLDDATNLASCEGDVGTHMMTGREICDVDRNGLFDGRDYFLD